MWYWIAFILFVLVVFSLRERFVEMTKSATGEWERTKITEPSLDAADWRSKIEAQISLGANEEDYIRELKRFYKEQYIPKGTPKDTDVEAFLQTATNIDKDSLRQIILSGFPIERTTTAIARAEKQQKIKDVGKYLEPRDGHPDAFQRMEPVYVPADTRIGELPEGVYENVEQQKKPRREGVWDDKSISWTRTSFFSLEKK
jgi:hypothetical protein